MTEIGFGFGVKDAIDILLVATVLFGVYRLLRHTGAKNIFWGILVFIIVWFITSYVFDMELTGAIMDQVINVGAIAIIVLFQEEIRTIFNSLGRRFRSFGLSHIRLMSSRSKEEEQRCVHEIMLACNHMSRSKTGALIIIRGKDELSDYEETGEPLDAAISCRLLENIFFKNTPLHDGALFIEGTRIVSAAAILPVSKNPDIPKHYGLRHRAALGISERTDVTAIIVSEETGKISVAKGGEINTLSESEVRVELSAAFGV